jgi:hypothetical protein
MQQGTKALTRSHSLATLSGERERVIRAELDRKAPLPRLWEREGPAAKRWEGEGDA